MGMTVRTAVIASILGVLVGTVASYLRHGAGASVRAYGSIDLSYGPSIYGQLIADATISGVKMPVLVDTGFAGDFILNTTCLRMATEWEHGVQAWNLLPTKTRLDLVESPRAFEEDEWDAHSAMLELGFESGTNVTRRMIAMTGVRTRKLHLTRASVHFSLSEGVPNHAPDPLGHKVKMLRMEVPYTGCIMTVDYLANRGTRDAPAQLLMGTPALGAGFQPRLLLGAAVSGPEPARPRQRVQYGVVTVAVRLGVEADAPRVWVVVDTGFAGVLTLDHDVAVDKLGQIRGKCRALDGAIQQVDVNGATVCTGAVLLPCVIEMEQGNDLQLRTRRTCETSSDDTLPVYVNDTNSSGGHGLLGMAALQALDMFVHKGIQGPQLRVRPAHGPERAFVAGGEVIQGLHTREATCYPDILEHENCEVVDRAEPTACSTYG